MKIYYYGLKYHEALLVARIFFNVNNFTLIKDVEKALTGKYSIISVFLEDTKSLERIRVIVVKHGNKFKVVKWSDLLVSLIH